VVEFRPISRQRSEPRRSHDEFCPGHTVSSAPTQDPPDVDKRRLELRFIQHDRIRKLEKIRHANQPSVGSAEGLESSDELSTSSGVEFAYLDKSIDAIHQHIGGQFCTAVQSE
jgi:hypothetical protein